MIETRYRIPSYAVLLLISIGYGFYSRWNGTAFTFSVIFGSLLVEAIGTYFRFSAAESRKQIRRMTPTEMDAYIQKLPPKKRQKFVANLLGVGAADDEYIKGLSPDERSQYDTLLERLRLEQRIET